MNDKPKTVTANVTTDVFWRDDVYVDAAATLAFEHLPTSAIKDDCIVVIDANVLLQPYEVDSKEAVNEIERVYRKLSDEKRLIVPGQSVREYQTHRPRKLAAVAGKLSGAIERLRKATIDRVPLLENEAEFSDIRNNLNAGRAHIELAIKGLQAQIDKLGADTGADPIANLYREVLSGCVVDAVHGEQERQDLVKEINRRVRLQIAPGFKDGDKEDLGIGDLVIWKTALSEGAKQSKNCIFVTMETKPDWWVRQNGAFLPRPELVEEYRLATGGKSVRLMPLSQLLSLFAAPQGVVTEVKQAEDLANLAEGDGLSEPVVYSSFDRLIDGAEKSARRIQGSIEQKQRTLARYERSIKESELRGLTNTLVHSRIEQLRREVNALTAQRSMMLEEMANLAWSRSIERRDNDDDDINA